MYGDSQDGLQIYSNTYYNDTLSFVWWNLRILETNILTSMVQDVEILKLEIEKEDRNYDYRHYSDSNNYDGDSENYRLSFTYRKYLGVDCKTIKENVDLKQQLELMKMCGRVNNNPSLAYNENFRLLVSKCRGITPTRDTTRPDDSQSLWDDMKDGYKKENPDLKLMNDKLIGPKKSKLKIPPKDYILPLPKPKDD